MTNRTLGQKKAFSVIEILVAFAAIGVLFYGALHAIIKAEQLRTLAVERNTAAVHANSALQHLQSLAITFNGKRHFLSVELEKYRYWSINGRPIDIGELPGAPEPTAFQQYIGIKKEDALKNESISIAFPSWASQMEANNVSSGYCKIYVKWQSTVPVVDQTIPTVLEGQPGWDAADTVTNQMIQLDGYLRFTYAGY